MTPYINELTHRGVEESQVLGDWLRVVQDVAGVGVWDWQINGPGAVCTESNLLLYGLPPSTSMPPHDEWLRLIHPGDRDRVCAELSAATEGSSRYETEFRVIWPDGTLHWLAGKCHTVCDSCGAPVRLIGVNYDITRLKEAEHASRAAAEKRRYEARHDPLTGLPNRRFFDQSLKHAIVQAADSRQMLAVLYLDLDGFKVVNDTLGHFVGDELLRGVTSRLRECLSESDMLARTGGDEFTIILTGIDGRNSVEAIAQELLNTLRTQVKLTGHDLYVTASVGISLFPEDGREAGVLQQNADVAMYHSKRSSKNGYRFFEPGMSEPLRDRLLLETALRGAQERDELSLQYQPLFSLNGGLAPVGFEALLRWSNPTLGSISPARLIPIAEDTGLIIGIGTWALTSACRQIRHWSEMGKAPGRIYVNVSGIQFACADFVDIVAGTLDANEVHGVSLGIEITESVLMSDFDGSSRKIRELQKHGVTVSVDDFGTGYSCLGYLQKLPIDALKIDGSFVREIGQKSTATAVIAGITSLAHSLDMRVVAECIETVEQLTAVREAGCDEGQGYLLGRPRPSDFWATARQDENALMEIEAVSV